MKAQYQFCTSPTQDMSCIFPVTSLLLLAVIYLLELSCDILGLSTPTSMHVSHVCNITAAAEKRRPTWAIARLRWVLPCQPMHDKTEKRISFSDKNISVRIGNKMTFQAEWRENYLHTQLALRPGHHDEAKAATDMEKYNILLRIVKNRIASRGFSTPYAWAVPVPAVHRALCDI